MSTLDPAGDHAARVAGLWWLMLAGAAVIFAGVVGLALYAFARRGSGAAVSDRSMLVGGGLVLPGVVLPVLLLGSLIRGPTLLGDHDLPVWRVEAEARQWAWEFRYPDAPEAAATPGVLHVPAGRPFEVRLISADVIHSFWVPRLGGKIDAIPGKDNRIRLIADRPGVYLGACAEFCGLEHAKMMFQVQAHAPADLAGAIGLPP